MENMRKLLNEFRAGIKEEKILIKKHILTEGAHSFNMIFSGTEQQLQAKWDEAVAEARKNTELAMKSDRYDPYSNSDIDELKGLMIDNSEVFYDEGDAREHILNKVEKYEYAIAVPLNDKQNKWLVGGLLSE